MKEVLALVIPLTVAAGVIVLLVTSKRRRDAKEKEETRRAQQAAAATSTAPQTAAAGGANNAPPAAGQGGQTSTTGGGAQTPNSAPAPSPKKKFFWKFFFGAWRSEFKTLGYLIVLGIVIGLVVLYGPGVWEKLTATHVVKSIPSTMGQPTLEQQQELERQKKADKAPVDSTDSFWLQPGQKHAMGNHDSVDYGHNRSIVVETPDGFLLNTSKTDSMLVKVINLL